MLSSTHVTQRSQRRSRIGVALFAVSLALLTGCGGDGEQRLNVLLVTVDCLRADHVGAYGYERDTTPNIDALAREGELFERSYSHAPFTAPSHASLLTSLVTESHGVVFWGHRLTQGAPTLGACFSEAGWRTGAFHNHPSLVPTGITRGFEHVSVRPFGPYAVTVRDFDGWLDGVGDRPFAAWVHLWDAHRPYGFRNYEDDTAKSLRALGVPARFNFAERVFADKHDERIGRHEGFYNLSLEERARPVGLGNGEHWLDQSDYRYISDRYDDGVRFADRGVAELVEALRRRGQLENTIIVVTADHGEALTDREACYFTHDPFLFDETLRVPLIVRWPDGKAAGTVRTDLARGIDVLPTLLAACGIERPPSFQGRDLAGPKLEGASAPLATASTRTHNAKETSRKVGEDEWIEFRDSVTDGRGLLVHDRDSDRWSYFDLALDPSARRDLLLDQGQKWPADALRLRAAWEELRASTPEAALDRGEMTAEERRLLERIGYF